MCYAVATDFQIFFCYSKVVFEDVWTWPAKIAVCSLNFYAWNSSHNIIDKVEFLIKHAYAIFSLVEWQVIRDISYILRICHLTLQEQQLSNILHFTANFSAVYRPDFWNMIRTSWFDREVTKLNRERWKRCTKTSMTSVLSPTFIRQFYYRDRTVSFYKYRQKFASCTESVEM